MVASLLKTGTSMKSLKHHPALYPLYGTLLFGCALATWYTMRLAARNPDCSWNKRTNPEPWQKLGENGKYKFYAPTLNYKTLRFDPERPAIEKMQ